MFVGSCHFVGGGKSVRVVLVVGYCVVIHKVTDVDDDFTFTAVKDFNAEAQVIGTLERDMRVADHSDVTFV